MSPPDNTHQQASSLLSLNPHAAESFLVALDADETIGESLKERLRSKAVAIIAAEAPSNLVQAQSRKRWMVKEIRIKGCRGISNGPHITFGHNGVLLYGDNGTGKTSYVDALEIALTGCCGSLDTGDQSISWKRHGTHIRSEKAEITVELTAGTSSAMATFDKDGQCQADPVLQDYIEAAQQRPFILRRRHLVKFIFARPADRYAAIEDFLSVDAFQDFEEAIKAEQRSAQAKVTQSEQERRGAESLLRHTLHISEDQPVGADSCLSTINTLLNAAGEPSISSIGEIGQGIAEAEKKLSNMGGENMLRSMQKTQTTMNTLTNVQPISVLDAAAHYLRAHERVGDEEGKLQGHFHADALQQASQWIEQDTLRQCPVCEQPIDPTSVIARIKRRLGERKTLIQLQNEQKEKRQRFIDAVKAWHEALKICDGMDVIPSHIRDTAMSTLESICQRHATLTTVEIIKQDIQALNDLHLDALRDQALQKLAKAQTAASEKADITSIIKVLQILRITLDVWSHLTVALGALQQHQSSAEALNRALVLAENGRKAAIDALLGEISTTATRYFEAIHPEEKLGALAISMRDKQARSLLLTSAFHEKQEEDPRGYYSEAHLDTLGLCVFLALRRRHFEQAPELSLLVLDDVVHSVDGAHRMRIAKLLFDEFGDHQLFITTHDPYWFAYLKQEKPSNDFPVRKIAAWSLEAGPQWGDHRSGVEWLIHPDNIVAQPHEKVTWAGRTLEEILQHLCHYLMIRVPFRLDGTYTIDPLWTNFFSKASKNNNFFNATRQHLENIDSLRRTRNWTGAHWSIWGQSLMGAEATLFVNSVLGLHTHCYCSKCHQFICNIKGLNDVWSCKNECLRYSSRPTTPSTTPQIPALIP